MVARVQSFDPTEYAGRTPREIPSYTVSEAARYLRAPKSTVRAWVMGQGAFRPVIQIARSSGPPLLTFVDLVEVHVLDALRRPRRLLEAHLRRIDKDVRGAPIRLYPFTRKRPLDPHAADVEEPRLIVIGPGLAFGRPALAGTGIPTEIIAERHKAGESIQELAEDYDRSPEEIEEAIRYELAAG